MEKKRRKKRKKVREMENGRRALGRRRGNK
jgi:hypothetical protein